MSRKESETEDPRRWLRSLAELETKGGQGGDDVGIGLPDGAPKTKPHEIRILRKGDKRKLSY